MGNFPLLGYASRAVYYPTALDAFYTNVIGAVSTPDTWGDWTEVVAATPFDCVLDWQNRTVTGNRAYKMALGADGSEVEIMGPVLAAGYTRWVWSWTIPIVIPAGTRISMKHQQQV